MASQRQINQSTATQRGLMNTSSDPGVNTLTNNATRNNLSSQEQSLSQINDFTRNSPLFQQSVANDTRNFYEDQRRFNEGLSFKNTADTRQNDTTRLGYNNQLEASRYNADAGVKSTELQANASRYGADKNAQASMYGADKSAQSSMYGADRMASSNISAARIGADASRFNALLSTGIGYFNAGSYRPSFNR